MDVIVSRNCGPVLSSSFGGLGVRAHLMLYLVAIVLASESLFELLLGREIRWGHRSFKVLVILLS